LNSCLIITNLYNNIGISSFVLDDKINDLLLQAQTGETLELTALRRLNKMLLCSIYTTQILTSATYLTPIDVSTILYFIIEDEMLGNGIQSNTITYDILTGEEIIEAIKRVSVVVNILSKKYFAKDATNFLNFAIQGERKISACYDNTLEFDLILFAKNQPIVLTEIEKGAWAERVEQRLNFKYTDILQLDVVASLQDVPTINDVKNVYQYEIEIKEG
jgi:hypothetical protein